MLLSVSALQHKTQFQSLIKQAKSRMMSTRKMRSASITAGAVAENGTQRWTDETSNPKTAFENDRSEQTECLISDDDVHADINDPNVVKVSEVVEKLKNSESAHSLPAEHSLASSKSTAGSKEESAVPDCEFSTEEETGSDIFEYDSDSMCVKRTAPARGKRKRALRPSQPSWQDTDGLDVSSTSKSSDKSLTGSSPGRSRSRSATSNEGCPLNAGHSRSTSFSNKFQSDPADDLLPRSQMNSELPKNNSDETKSGCSFRKSASGKSSPHFIKSDLSSNKSQTESLPIHLVDLSDSDTDNSSQNSKTCQPSLEGTNSDSRNNAEDLAADGETKNQIHPVISDTDTSPVTTIQGLSTSEEVQMLVSVKETKVGKRTYRDSMVRGKRGSDTRKRRHKKEESESLHCEDAGTIHDDHAEITSSPKVGAAGLCQRESPSEPTDLAVQEQQATGASVATEEGVSEPEGSEGASLTTESSSCFEMTLSDIEEESTPPPSETKEALIPVEVHLIPTDILQLQANEGAKSPKRLKLSAKEEDFQPRRHVPKPGSLACNSSENPEAVTKLLPLSEAKQELEEEEGLTAPAASQITKLKSLLRKKRKSAAWYKKSVRFAGLRARISDVHIEGRDSSESDQTSMDNKLGRECTSAEPLPATAIQHDGEKTAAPSHLETAESQSGVKGKVTEPASTETTECVVLLETHQVHKQKMDQSETVSPSHDLRKRDRGCSKNHERKKRRKKDSTSAKSDEEDSHVEKSLVGEKVSSKLSEDTGLSSSMEEASGLPADQQRDKPLEAETSENKPTKRQHRKQKKSASDTVMRNMPTSCMDTDLSERSPESDCKKERTGSLVGTKIIQNIPELNASSSEQSSTMNHHPCGSSKSAGNKVAQVIPGSHADLSALSSEIEPRMLPMKGKKGKSRRRKYAEVDESDHKDGNGSDEGRELAMSPADIVKTKQRQARHAAKKKQN